jgi:hypothetical protein
MYLIEIFLPLADNAGEPFSDAKFAEVRDTLTRRFGGLTAFTRSPASGVVRQGGKHIHDDIVIIEVMAETLDREIWKRYRKQLEQEFAQDRILVRATAVEQL